MRGALTPEAGAPHSGSAKVMLDIDLSMTAWCKVADRIIFLDIAKDRFFCLCDDRNRAMVAELESGNKAFWFQPECFPRPAVWCNPETNWHGAGAGQFRLSEVARALWLQRRVEARLASTSFEKMLGSLKATLGAQHDRIEQISKAAEACIHGFEHAQLIRTAADRCLPRSIALALGLAARGCRTQLFIGVKTSPFGAHCWLQHGSDVLSDSVEEVRRYQPILIL